MQRIGRVDRRLDPAVEDQMIRDHPELAQIRRHCTSMEFLTTR